MAARLGRRARGGMGGVPHAAQVVEWSGSGAPAWAARIDAGLPVYGWIRDAAAWAGIHDGYELFGAAVFPSFLLIWFSLQATTRLLGRAGAVLSWLTLAGAPVVVGSYLAHDEAAPIRYVWGAEFFLLVAIGLAALAAGLAAWPTLRPRWRAVLVASTPLILVVATLALTYYPHGSLVGIGVEAGMLAAAGGGAAVAGTHAPTQTSHAVDSGRFTG